MKATKLDLITEELRRIASDNGGVLLPKTVVEEARSKASPLHSRFEWDDGVAADAYRLHQARQLIRVVVEKLPNMKVPTEVFVSLSPDRNKKDGGYRLTTEVLSDKQLREILFQDALEELEIFREKYKRLRELSEVFKAINKLSSRKSKMKLAA